LGAARSRGCDERRIGHAVRLVSHSPANRPTSTDKIEAALNALLADQRAGNGSSEPH
jgi:hypothetical protein